MPIEVEREPIPEAAFTRPPLPELKPGNDANTLEANLAALWKWIGGPLDQHIDGLDSELRCRVNGECEAE